MKIRSEQYGLMPDGDEVHLFSLANDRGTEVKIINYGGIITNINLPDGQGKVADIVLGLDTLEGYLTRSRYFGSLIGRFGNRIARGRFVLNDVAYHLAINNGVNHLHGGVRGFDKVFWQARQLEDALELTYQSEHGEEGYPVTSRHAWFMR